MKILTVDIGTGTQDIFLYDSRLDIENGFKLVLPSPTIMIHNRIREATRQLQPILLTGVMMGGGPSAWAVEGHLKAGLPVFATPSAARTINDELEKVETLGVRIVSDTEATKLADSTTNIEMRDLDLPAIRSVFGRFGVTLKDLTAVAVAVFDHGDAEAMVFGEDAVEQCGFAGAEEAGEDGDGDHAEDGRGRETRKEGEG